MDTEIFKIDAEMAEKIKVEVGTFNTEINFLTVCHFPNEGCQLKLQFSQPFLHQDLLLMMGTEIFKIDASWAENLTKTRVPFLMIPTVL